MSSYTAGLRTALKEHIEAKANAAHFVLNNFAIEETYLPWLALTDNILTTGKLWIVLYASDHTGYTRSNAVEEMIPIGFGFQINAPNPLDAGSLDQFDQLIQLVEELKLACTSLADKKYSWDRTESMKDENGIPISFTGLREAQIFEAYWVSFYKTFVVEEIPT